MLIRAGRGDWFLSFGRQPGDVNVTSFDALGDSLCTIPIGDLY